jgi:ATP-dependent DNA helicase PIF1
MIDYKAHHNVEFCGETYAVLYLYKYLFKGNQKVSMQLNNLDGVHEKDEILAFQRGRMLCAMQAWWYVWGYQSYPASTPSVHIVKVKLPHQVKDLAKDGKACDLAVYFARPHETPFEDFTYSQLFEQYDYCAQPPSRPSMEVRISNISNGKVFYLYKRIRGQQIVRLCEVPLAAGEIFWLRTLLYRIPCYSFAELLLVDGIRCSSFQQAAVARKLVQDEDVTKEIFAECITYSTPRELRVLFTNMTLNGFPTTCIYASEDLRTSMYADYNEARSFQTGLCINRLLRELATLFKVQDNAMLSDYGLPEPAAQETELDLQRLKYPAHEQQLLLDRLLQRNPLTPEMARLFRSLRSSMEQHETTIIILQGKAGTGKSTFAEIWCAYVRSMGYTCLGCASTGLAAAVYDDFLTAHSLFAIPVLEDEESYEQEGDLQCKLNLPKYAQRKQLLTDARSIIWDEISSQHMRDITAVLSAMNNFEGKVVLLIGDALQITPVVPYGNKSQICSASVYCAASIQQLAHRFTFTKNLRLCNADVDPAQVEYANLLNRIATNTEDREVHPRVQFVEDKGNGQKLIQLALFTTFTDVTSVLAFCFPRGFHIASLHECCILAATNQQVEDWNNAVQGINNHEPHVLPSQDEFSQVDDPHGYISRMVTNDVMNSFTDSGKCPPHNLILKVDDLCILMRAVNKDEKFTTNTRVRIVSISRYIVRVCTLDADHARYCNLPRFLFKLRLPFGKSFTMTRRQFPLRLAYALTMNKCQGQTLHRCVVDLTHPPFMHGHLNVALSRIRDASQIALFVSEEQISQTGSVQTTNVVYPEILAAI